MLLVKFDKNVSFNSLQKRLEVVGSAGLPVWITELDIRGIEDPTEKADAYDDVITLYFSDPNIDGVLLWGFSDIHHVSPDAALFEGPDYTVSLSGTFYNVKLKLKAAFCLGFNCFIKILPRY